MKTDLRLFTGFYCSIHSDLLEYELQHTFENDKGELNLRLFDLAQDCLNYSNIYEAYAKEYTGQMRELLNIKSLIFEELDRPREYNFRTDSIYCDISENDVIKIFNEVDKTKLAQTIKEQHTSYDGFHSFYSNNLNIWLKNPLDEWDAVETGTLLLCYIKNNTDYDDIDLKLYEMMQESSAINNIIFNNADEKISRLLKISSYLIERENRQ